MSEDDESLDSLDDQENMIGDLVRQSAKADLIAKWDKIEDLIIVLRAEMPELLKDFGL